ncbi:MAG: hypothetical protein KKB45_15425, partial [Gammaproteobacteria bacterium]|nr:hypothetical protein [Gammaproteobacteria bacterium]
HLSINSSSEYFHIGGNNQSKESSVVATEANALYIAMLFLYKNRSFNTPNNNAFIFRQNLGQASNKGTSVVLRVMCWADCNRTLKAILLLVAARRRRPAFKRGTMQQVSPSLKVNPS